MSVLQSVLLSSVISFTLLQCGVGSECEQANPALYTPNVIFPINCTPTDCDAKVAGHSVGKADGLECNIGNYAKNMPHACVSIKHDLQTRRSPQTAAEEDSEKPCHAKLSSIGLFDFVCNSKQLTVEEVALTFTFQFPICGRAHSVPGESVMVDFYARNDSFYNFYAEHPICRVFNYGGSDFTRLLSGSHATPEVKYDCMGIGLQVNTHTIIGYYLSFVTYPAGAFLNYTLVFKDVEVTSLRLVGAAWLNSTAIHVIFSPVDHIPSYTVEAVSGTWRNTTTVSSPDPSLEIHGIPKSTAVTITVTPTGKDCRNENAEDGCNIQVTLYYSGIQLASKTDDTESPVPHSQINLYIILGVTFLIVILVVGLTAPLVLCRKNPYRPQIIEEGDEVLQPVVPLKVMLITDRSMGKSAEVVRFRKLYYLTREILQQELENSNCDVENVILDEYINANQIDGGHCLMMRGTDVILIQIHPNSAVWDYTTKLIAHIAESREQLKHKLWCVRDSNNESNTSDLLRSIVEKYPDPEPFLIFLDSITFFSSRTEVRKLVENIKISVRRRAAEIKYEEEIHGDAEIQEDVQAVEADTVSQLESVVTVIPLLHSPPLAAEASWEEPERAPSENSCNCQQCHVNDQANSASAPSTAHDNHQGRDQAETDANTRMGYLKF